ncbi:anhydro-N-acetylmuramic acid kinase [Roseivirga sp. E12]|uniref:anhydro-N-acetylmuramic acid kinase n=1 Tax=Roseivirga sp. E12 TaxID=2819237 RepID=UPI001ABC929A|nr:anhydro-N-acetylmuramic acid kinase [Roseivirga sp. E12]MBO3699843.1 anhydro-N-acetylmuramic acid kinase [Roseivirga sp. E12]
MQYKIVGIMSGTSLDGLDLVLVTFKKVGKGWQFVIDKSETVAYPQTLQSSLRAAVDLTKVEIQKLDTLLGKFIGQAVKTFLNNDANIHFIASHGHTIFHQPEEGITLQIGSGAHIAESSGFPVINNFRAKDVSLGGQGAPLVPIGDRDLFSEYSYCLNLGGIANVSYDFNGLRLAYDICPFNMALNVLANEIGLDFDDRGILASQGKVDNTLLEALSDIPYLSAAAPKSLGIEDYRKFWQPIVSSSKVSIEDKMCTFTEHVAMEIGKALKGSQSDKTLITGGGAFHDYFIHRLKSHTSTTISIPDQQTINFKEALVFAYLGLLRHLDQPNCLSSVTGASTDSSGGDLHKV